ncbi:MAG: LemA family protein [Patescibacteria group bacterium]
MNTAVALILGFIVIVGVALLMYNHLITLRNRVEEAWADIDVQLRRRYDLIPNLVEAVKGYAKHEQETLQQVMEARSKASSIEIDASTVSAEAIGALAGAEAGLGGMLGKLMAVAEAYPDLKADANFLDLQNSLEDTENKIQAARRFYNGTVRDFNTITQTIPFNLFVSLGDFAEREYFELPKDSEVRDAVEVQF